MAVKKPAIKAPKPRSAEEIPATVTGNNADLESKRPVGRPRKEQKLSKSFTVTMDDDLYQSLRARAEADDRTLSYIVRQALEAYL